MELKEAILNVVAMIDKMPYHHLDAALNEIDVGDESFEEALDVLKKECEWEVTIPEDTTSYMP